MQDKTVFEAISFAAPMGVMQADEAGLVIEASRRMEILLQTGARGALGSNWLASVHPQDRERVASAAALQAFARESKWRVACSQPLLDGLEGQVNTGRTADVSAGGTVLSCVEVLSLA